MTKKSKDALRRSDKILVGVSAVVLAAASAAVGATAAYRPSTDRPREVAVMSAPKLVLQSAAEPAAAAADNSVTITSGNDEQVRPVAVSSFEQTVLDKLLREHRCLSEAMYYEARGEGERGEKAVAEVVFHRLRSGKYGHSICAVVYEGAYRPGCQFSFTCNGMVNQRKMPDAWMKAQLLAAKIMTNEEHLNDITGGATSYHATSVQPDWAGYLTRTVQIGNHVFYKHHHGSQTM